MIFKIYAEAIESSAFKAMILLISCGLFGVSCYGVSQLKAEFDEIENAIITAQVKSSQESAINRLATKLECTVDCFMSSSQADSLDAGLARNDDNVAALIDDINSAASNLSPNMA